MRARLVARWAALIATLISGFGWEFFDGAGRSLLLAIGWIALPPIAVGLGYGDGFLLEHGRGAGRALVTIIGGTIVSLTSCVVLAMLASDGDGARSRLPEGCAYALLYGSILLTIGSILAIAFGPGAGYLARRIQQTDDEGW